MSKTVFATSVQEDRNRDLGFGAVVARESRQRLLNRNGSFNVRREGLSLWTSLNPYHLLLTISWPKFFGLVILFYLAVNSLFALAYLLCGPAALAGEGVNGGNAFMRAFFFSVQTLSTIGYGHISPLSLAANLIVALEALIGLLGVALITGILFARFARPTAKILFSEHAIVAPYHGITAFEFRLANARRNQLVELNIKVILAVFEEAAGRRTRRFYKLELEREQVVFFPLSWTVVHPINENSPLWQRTEAELDEMGAEFLILLTAFDETFSQTVHARSSYKHDEVIWNARFGDVFRNPTQTGSLIIDVGKLDLIERFHQAQTENRNL